MSEPVLIVLYQCNTDQFWCAYSGGSEEADTEWDLIAKENPGVIEKGRLWVNEAITYTAVGEKT